MRRGELVLLVPSQLSRKGVTTLAGELTRQRVSITAKDDALVLAKWGRQLRKALAKGISVRSYHTDKIRSDVIGSLPEHAARVAMLWNWTIDNRDKHLTDRDVRRIMANLQLEIKNGEVYDRLRGKSLGKVRHKVREANTGNYCINRSWGTEWIYGFLGVWYKGWCRTRTYLNYPECSGTRYPVAYISALVDGIGSYGNYDFDDNDNSSEAYASDWDYLWMWGAGGNIEFRFGVNTQEWVEYIDT